MSSVAPPLEADEAVPRSVTAIADLKVERPEDLGQFESERAFSLVNLARKRHGRRTGAGTALAPSVAREGSAARTRTASISRLSIGLSVRLTVELSGAHALV